jgi:hypothetical protein
MAALLRVCRPGGRGIRFPRPILVCPQILWTTSAFAGTKLEGTAFPQGFPACAYIYGSSLDLPCVRARMRLGDGEADERRMAEQQGAERCCASSLMT